MYNTLLITQFEKLIDQIKHDIDISPNKKTKLKHSFRLKKIKDVVNIIRKFPTEITSSNQLKDIKGVGTGTLDRIDEILKTGSLSEINVTSNITDRKAIEELEDIYGIGPKIAYDLVIKENIKSVDELIKAYKSKKIDLNDQILIGIKYHNLYKPKIPREEVFEIDTLIHKYMYEVSPELVGVICGSYRRLKMTSNDVDLLLVHPDIKTQEDLTTKKSWLDAVVKKLKSSDFIVDDLTPDYQTKYMGFCKFNNTVRRIDIRYIPYNSYYTALLYFTGPGDFNQKMRMLAIGLNMKLNEYGLYKLYNNDYISLTIKSEKDVFDYLGMEFVPPEKRL